MTKPRRFQLRMPRFRVPHWGWLLLATFVLVVGFVGLSVWLAWHREQQLIRMVESWEGYAVTETGGPQWLRQIVGEERMKKFKVFERVHFVNLGDSKVSDRDLAQLRKLTKPNMVYLDRTAITDSGLLHLTMLTTLEVLDLRSTAVTDSGLVQLGKSTNLRLIHVDDTAVTAKGIEELQKELPRCVINH